MMRLVIRFIEEKLGLIVNIIKIKVIRFNDFNMKFLGFGFFKDF
ncbi:hypothetical protein A33I_20970 [Alkalihalophilus marmarensis DSM 21297]|uniref:Uncharacterized protein n=1 Tax=Alkalihalophilus marmarensis DSM 21297 TaxID=1188261 RepID=U6SHS1_9BACI|nr:hypothetical protein A33I_20970 [Alkalihalophilus marmarensis DSM 21297]